MLASLRSRIRKRAVRAAHLELGDRGERAALEYLKEEGFAIVATNYRVPLGRSPRGQKISGEIDIIAYEEDTLVFIEVKTRSSDDLVAPERAVGLKKQQQIARAARRYRQLLKINNEPHRFDVVSVVAQADTYKIELLRGFFDERTFFRSKSSVSR